VSKSGYYGLPDKMDYGVEYYVGTGLFVTRGPRGHSYHDTQGKLEARDLLPGSNMERKLLRALRGGYLPWSLSD
jgi:hypothetical protein